MEFRQDGQGQASVLGKSAQMTKDVMRRLLLPTAAVLGRGLSYSIDVILPFPLFHLGQLKQMNASELEAYHGL